MRLTPEETMETAEHTRMIRARVRPEMLKEIKQLALDRETSIQQLIIDGLEMVLATRTKKERKSK